jgi:hypothetical protein
MAGVITTGAHPKALWPGMHAFFGSTYGEHPEEYRELFAIEKSSKNYEEDTKLTGFGMAPVKGEGQAVSYDSESQGFTKRYTHVVYGLGYVVTEEEIEDNLYEQVSKRRIKRLAFSMRQTKETVSANVLNRAFSSSYTGGDAKELCATDHPSMAGNYSNELATPADFAEASLEDMVIQISNAVNERGHKIKLVPKKLIHPTAIQFDVSRVLKSELTPGTANNAVNAVRMVGVKPVMNHYLTDTDNWFVTTDAPNGLQMFERRVLAFAQDNDHDTGNAKAKATMRFSVGWTDPLGVYGSEAS